jgi:UDP-N-acetylmuramoyl-tripeptide--D-alanyl-D-alanine ligase
VLQNSAPPRGLILGDMKELGEQTVWYHQQAGHRVKASGIEYLWAIGQMSRYAVESFGEGAYHFTRHQDLIEAVRSQSLTGATLLVKGSRSMQMEQVVNALLEGTENAAVD